MNKQIKKILTILILIVILPALFFTVYELNSRSVNEKIIQNIYENQLNTIIYSINSYSEDLVSNWGKKISAYYQDEKNLKSSGESRIYSFLKQFPSISYIYFIPLKRPSHISVYNLINQSGNENEKQLIPLFINKNKTKIEKLSELLQKGFQKFEPVQDNFNEGITQIIFLSDNSDDVILTGIAVDSKKFIDEILSNKITSVAQQTFIISVFDKQKNENIYSNEPQTGGEYRQSKMLWLLPRYEIAIKLKGLTIEEIASKRINTNLVLVATLTILLIIGAAVIIKNIQKEVKLAEIKSEFVSNVSHELRTPLSLINMFAETLSLGRVKTEEKKKEYYAIITQEAGRLSSIVNKILNFSQIEAGKRNYTFEIIDLNEIVNKIAINYQYHLQSKGFKFDCNISEPLGLINGDSGAITEAIINLLDNSVKYSSEKKEIKISTGEKEGFIFAAVEDRGIGISNENQKRIYEKFYRVSSGLIHNTKGTGLGLAIVKHIMDAHKAKIELQSRPGEGSRFILKFKKSDITT